MCDEFDRAVYEHVTSLQSQVSALRHDAETLAEALAKYEGPGYDRHYVIFKHLGRTQI